MSSVPVDDIEPASWLSSVLGDRFVAFVGGGGDWRSTVSAVLTELVVWESPHPGGPGMITFHSFFGSNSI